MTAGVTPSRSARPANSEHAVEVSFDRFEVVFPGVDRAGCIRAGRAQRRRERQILVGVGDVILFASVDEGVQPQPRDDRPVGVQMCLRGR